jgi:hypothetical protein
MFSDKYKRNVQWFGPWAGQNAHSLGKRDAVQVLYQAALVCFEQDARTGLVDQALRFLQDNGVREGYIKRFRQALDIESPVKRYAEVKKAYEAICKHL